jgi:hypothetical protein
MARVTTFGPVTHSSDAGFRAWVAEIISMLTSAGLVHTSDTGQIDTATVVRPASGGGSAGYAIFRFNDALQATRPIYLRLSFGTSSTTTSPRFYLQVGTGTDGAGNLTGNVTAELSMSPGNAFGNGNYSSYAIHKDGYAALAYKVGNFVNNIPQQFIVQRTVDNAGDDTDEGAMVIFPSTAASVSATSQCVRMRFAPHNDQVSIVGSALGFVPGAITDSRVSLAPQVFPHWIMMPKQKPLLYSAASIRGEIAAGAEFSMVLVGAVSRNYLGLGLSSDVLGAAVTTRSDLCILWED